MLEEIAKIVGEKSVEISEQAIARYKAEHPECDIDAETKTLIMQRVNSQLTFRLSEFKAAEDEFSEEDFVDWLKDGVEKSVGEVCYRYLEEEEKKHIKDSDQNLTFLEKYLRDHKRRR